MECVFHFLRLVRGERGHSIVGHTVQHSADVSGHIYVRLIAFSYEWMFQQLVVLGALGLLLDQTETIDENISEFLRYNYFNVAMMM